MAGSRQPGSGPANASPQSDVLLWFAAAVIAGLGVTWLLISQPWSSGDSTASVAPSIAAAVPASERTTEENVRSASTSTENTLDNPLRMAELAFEAGMLVEPEEYSAWTLYAQVFEIEPDNEAAAQGLLRVADELIRRANAALEQGRFEDARRATERILGILPTHAGARELAEGIEEFAPKRASVTVEAAPLLPTPPAVAVERPAPARPPAVAPVVPDRPPVPRPDPLAETLASFERAMTNSRLLTPIDENAKRFARELFEIDSNHEHTRDAQQRLSQEFLSRATQALEGLDTQAASTWIDEAELLGIDANGVAAARSAMADRLAAMESARPLPASELAIADYVAPEYPERALLRGLEGWVDIEFTVATDGSTTNVTVTAASHDNFFRREATQAVEQWRFEPRVFMNRTIEQRSYTRIRFVL
jgi:protein TonB